MLPLILFLSAALLICLYIIGCIMVEKDKALRDLRAKLSMMTALIESLEAEKNSKRLKREIKKMKRKKKKSPNGIAKALHTPHYRQRVKPNAKKKIRRGKVTDKD